MDYKNGKIYVIRNHVNNMVYVGCTTQTLAKRFSKHKSNLGKKYALYNAMTELGVENFYIELLENYPCETKDELNARESHFIREYDSFNSGYNKRIEGRTKTEWYNDNKKEIQERTKKWREENKHKLYKTIECECGGKHIHEGKSIHIKTKRHQNFILSKSNERT